MPDAPHADRASADLRAAMLIRHYTPVRDAVHAFGKAVLAMREAGDIEQTTAAAARYVDKMGALAEAAEAAFTAARADLAAIMELGQTNIDVGDDREAYLRQGTRNAYITDENAVPKQFWVVPPAPAPHWNLTEIGQRLRKGQMVAGCALGNGGAPVVCFRAKKGVST